MKSKCGCDYLFINLVAVRSRAGDRVNHLLGFHADVFIECLLIATQTKPVGSDGRTGWRTTPPTPQTTSQHRGGVRSLRRERGKQHCSDTTPQGCTAALLSARVFS